MRRQRRALGLVEIAACDQMIRQRPGLVMRPRMERREELRLVNQTRLQGQKSKKQMLVSGIRHRRASQRQREDRFRTHSALGS